MKLPENILPLIDGDWIAYTSCAAVEGGKDRPDLTDFNEVLTVLARWLVEIKKELKTDKEPILCFNGNGNFRYVIAKQKKYKGARPPKPFHYQHLLDYMSEELDVVRKDGLEGDDTMAIFQTHYEKKGKPSCIVSIDKDLRQVPGWTYSPEIWNAPKYGPIFVDEMGEIELVKKSTWKIVGNGLKFFYSQILTGDAVDNVPGLNGCGAKMAFTLINECTTEGEMYEAVRWAYRDVSWQPDECLLEQAQLVWMVREVNEVGEPVMWTPPVLDILKEGDEL